MGLGDLSPDDGADGGAGGGGGDDLLTNTDGRRKYIQPSKEEFEECLERASGEWTIDPDAPGREYVYENHDFMEDYNGIVLRVYSTIDERTDMARSKGADAIRLVVFNRHAMRPMGGRKKTLRIETYCKNLLEKINSIFDEYDRYVNECSECGSWMVIREGKYGEFLGCTNYPKCENTEDIEDE